MLAFCPATIRSCEDTENKNFIAGSLLPSWALTSQSVVDVLFVTLTEYYDVLILADFEENIVN